MSKWKKPWVFRLVSARLQRTFQRCVFLSLWKWWKQIHSCGFLWDFNEVHIGNLGGGNSKIVYFVTSIFFKLGWFNHQRGIHSLKHPAEALCASNQQDYVFIDGLGLEHFSAPMKNWGGREACFLESIHNSSSFFFGMVFKLKVPNF